MRESRVDPQRPVPTMKRWFDGLTPAPWYPGARPRAIGGPRRLNPSPAASAPIPTIRGSHRAPPGGSWWRRWRAPSSACSGAGVPGSPRDRAEGFRHLLRFLAAGHLLCVEHADPDHPRFARMVDPAWQWGLDMPDCLYLYAPLRGDAAYRVWGRRGSAHHVDLQVNWGHFAQGDIAAWGTVSSASADELEVGEDGSLELWLGGPPRPRNWLPVAPNAEFLLVRQYFADWEAEQPADLAIERLGGGASAAAADRPDRGAPGAAGPLARPRRRALGADEPRAGRGHGAQHAGGDAAGRQRPARRAARPGLRDRQLPLRARTRR